MSTNTKLSYLNETKSELKEALNNLGASIIDSDSFRIYVGKINSLYNEWEKVEGTGTNITLSPTKKGKMIFEYKGYLSQETTSISGGDEYDSPTPEHPQNIKVATGTQNVEVCGKNLLNTNNVSIKTGANFNGEEDNVYTVSSNNAFSFAIVPVPSNTNITLSMNNADYSNTRFYVSCLKNKTTEAGKTGGWYTGSGTILTTEKTHYLGIVINIRATGSTSSTTATQELINALKIQVEQNSTATTYQAYQGNTYQLNLGNIELCEILDYQDFIYKNNENWYIKKYIKKLDMSTINSWGASNSYQFYRTNFVNAYDISIGKVYSNVFLYDSTSWAGTYKFGISSTGSLWLQLPTTSEETKDTIANYLGTINAIMYGILSTPTDTQITDNTLLSQLNAIDKALSYENETNIIITGNEPAILNVKALKKIS